MGDVLISRRGGNGGGSSPSGGFELNYVTGGSYYTKQSNSLIDDTTGESLFLQGTFGVPIVNGQNLTLELCTNLRANSHHERYISIGAYSYERNQLVISSDRQSDSAYYLETNIFGVGWAGAENEAAVPRNQDITMSFLFSPSTVEVFMNGTSFMTIANRGSNNFYGYSSGYIELLDTAAVSNRGANGILYAFRMYPRLLTSAEIQNNYLEDVKLINHLSGN